MDTKTVIKYLAIAAGIYILYNWLRNNGYLDSIMGSTHPAVAAATDAAKTVDSATAAAQKAASDLAAAKSSGDPNKIAAAQAAKDAAVMAAQKAADTAAAAHAALVKVCTDSRGNFVNGACVDDHGNPITPVGGGGDQQASSDPLQAAADKLIAAARGVTSFGVDEWNYYLSRLNQSAVVSDLGLPRGSDGKTQPMDALTFLKRRQVAGLPVGLSGVGMGSARNWWDNLTFDGAVQ